MIEKILLGLVLVFFILAFAIRNIKTYLSTRQSIKGKSNKLTFSILISTLIYLIILLRLVILEPEWILELKFFDSLVFRYIGFVLIAIGFVFGILALIAMKKSWRVGIKYEQKTELVMNGIYRLSRNPYFFSYDILILGYVFIFPSIVLMILLVVLAAIFHSMILEEEKYLTSVHGDKYLAYCRTVNWYITII